MDNKLKCMCQHSVQWPADQMHAVEIAECDGAYFVHYKTTDGAPSRVLKGNGRPKGFRSLYRLILHLKSVCNVDKFTVTLQLRKPKS